jgi:hypothetical protein
MLARYVLTLGIILACAGAAEVIMPLRAFSLWRRWSSSRFFFLHGLLLIAAGFPLTLYQGPLSRIIFAIGLLASLTGPFVLLYPDKFRMMFASVADEMKDASIMKIVRVEGFLRLAAAGVCVAAFFMG